MFIAHTQFFNGVATSVGAGLCFATGAGLIAVMARRGSPFLPFLSMGALFACCISLVVFVDWRSLDGVARLNELIVWISAGALANVAGHFAMARSMQSGRGPVSWAIGQGGQMLSFLAAVIIWNETTGLVGVTGVVLIIGGVIMLALIRPEAGANPVAHPERWLCWALIAMGCYGLNQTLMAVPSRWENWTDTARLRVPITCAVIAVAGFAIRPPRAREMPGLLPWAFAYSLVCIGCFALIYRALDLLSASGRGSVVWPIACSSGVIAYAAWERLIRQKRNSTVELVGLASIILGILTLASETLVR